MGLRDPQGFGENFDESLGMMLGQLPVPASKIREVGPLWKEARDLRSNEQILAYAAVLLPVAMAPWFIGGTGMVYGLSALVLGTIFLILSIKVGLRKAEPDDGMRPEKRLFGFSILYLFLLFGMLVADRVATLQGWQA